MDHRSPTDQRKDYDGCRFRKAATGRADRWTSEQASRMMVEPAVITDAVHRGHLPTMIETYDNHYELAVIPQMEGGIEFKVIGYQPVNHQRPY